MSKNQNVNFNKEELQKELDQKISNSFKSEDAYVDYMGQTLKSFAFRYLPTHTESKMSAFKEEHYFGIESFENNMGNAFKILDSDIKAGIKSLAKSIPMSEKPEVRYRLGIDIRELSKERGKLVLISEIHWGFPAFLDQQKKQKKLNFDFDNLHDFRKLLALRLEDVADLFN